MPRRQPGAAVRAEKAQRRRTDGEQGAARLPPEPWMGTRAPDFARCVEIHFLPLAAAAAVDPSGGIYLDDTASLGHDVLATGAQQAGHPVKPSGSTRTSPRSTMTCGVRTRRRSRPDDSR